MKKLFLPILLFTVMLANGQEKSGAQQFWDNLRAHCGKAYEGKLAPHVTNDAFSGKTLTMFVRTCDDGTITIPFYVGEDKSRTWVLTLEGERIKLKHDHRHEDGSEDKITQYGGTSTNSGSANLQFFPADVETAELIGYAATNVWWITLDENTFTYNLKRIGTENPAFNVIFDLNTPVEAPGAQWGWE
ncbi:hypothetical protein FK178_08035 [Antarcticibacterium arcticum]|uniref:Secreted protein n=1 Tax=Antarcticibacterium arcticum TaxID=2585771 RepID=A0A5B8YIW8_9FLAO|nr:hypothetical protein [Antarcticibacterium arcticum]QED37675.1 hypothetical protein FK178_08035 [Antarcticibacterium arcticum]